MKMFRRISALALAVVMICLLGTSAFAAASYTYDYRDSYPVGDSICESVAAFADIDEHVTIGFVEIISSESIGNEIGIVYDYRYHPDDDPDNILDRHDNILETNVTGSSLGRNLPSTFQMNDAEYSFSVTYVTSYGTDYCGFDSGVITYP